MAEEKRARLLTQLEHLAEVTTIVADTGDIESIKKFSPQVSCLRANVPVAAVMRLITCGIMCVCVRVTLRPLVAPSFGTCGPLM
jgi:hypothetical protein